MFRIIYPKGSGTEAAAFVCQHSAEHIAVYSVSAISLAEKRMGFTRKEGCTTANQATNPINVMRRRHFWSQPIPIGIRGVQLLHLIDIDEAAFFIQTANRIYGKSLSMCRVRDLGSFRGGDKFTLCMTISPSGRRWFTLQKRSGIDQYTFASFCTDVMHDLPVDSQCILFYGITYLHMEHLM